MEVKSKYSYSKQISKRRNYGKLDEAINIAIEAKKNYPEENIFEKILGDLYLQNRNYEEAGNAYINFLIKIDDNIQYVKHFAKFMERYAEAVDDLSGYLAKVQNILDKKIRNENVIVGICEIISPYVEYPEIQFFIHDRSLKEAKAYINKIEKSCKFYILYYKILSINHTKDNRNIDKYVVSLIEKKARYTEALSLIVKVLKHDQDRVAVRTLFRICRKLDDYSEAEKYIVLHPSIENQSEFNILYELVFYYSKIGNIENRNHALKKIKKCGRNSVPIMRTLYNFYLQFGMLDEAVEIKNIITGIQGVKKETSNVNRNEQENDSAEALVKTIKELFTELEHSRKLISMSELLKGFSHELGQPITNIRYGVQLFQMKMEKGINTNEELKILFENILSQTYRIKNMLARFSPITSEKNTETYFSVTKEIKEVFGEFSSRLSKENIEWEVESNTDFSLFGDNIKFDQIFYNLIGNAIYAINEKGERGTILVTVSENETEFNITFEDNGIGIAPEYLGKIFDPFFTTKERSNDENGGGEGLGLYIIWNIVRMFDGNIKVDKEYQNGAKFIINILKKGNERYRYE